jgi:hypothetical protein
MTIVLCKLNTKYVQFPNGMVEIECSENDAPWIQELEIKLGAGNHPCGTMPDGSIRSLARQILQRYGIPIELDSHVYRWDVSKPLDVSHENLCVPLDLLPRKDCLDGIRSVVLADWLNYFINTKTKQLPEPEPTIIQCLDIEKMCPVFFQGDSNDLDWLDGKVVKFSTKGIPLVQVDWNKFIPISAAQAKHHMPDRPGLMLRYLAPHTPLDIRKHLILTIAPNGRMWTGMVSPQ